MARVISDETSLSKQRRGLRRETAVLSRLVIAEAVLAALVLAWGLVARLSSGSSGPLWGGAALAFLAAGHWMKSRDNAKQENFINAGQKGEAQVAATLGRDLDNSYYVLNDIQVRSGFKKAQIDHVVIGPNGVFVIETKNWRGRISGDAADKAWMQKKYDDQPMRRIGNPVLQNRRHAEVVRSLLGSAGLADIRVIPLLVFTSKHATLDIANLDESILWPAEVCDAIRRSPGPTLGEDRIDAVLHRFQRFM